ncbi:MAG: undecaprenyl-diphosphatase [Candidimonas sp.]|nr:MAG: undecaprenyl-diphosphatase [Candidimonas sp.]TAM20503.1 MAG: undecaprenyl-diphosphatase [Candidimonas sp.]TAM77908.1 MAG: undecaprenyl-diphosphatase [Candidimonas sp.]
MENFNDTLFLLLNAPAHPSAPLLVTAIFFAKYVIWAIPGVIGIGWLWGNERCRKIMLEATASGLVGLLISQIIGFVWPHPRPFVIGLGHTFIAHAADPSFPSDHLTLLWAVAFSFFLHRSLRLAGLGLALLGLPVAWARIYIGVHFPLDMVGAMFVAALSAWLAFRAKHSYLPTAYGIAIRIHHILFGKLIKLGWVRR